MKVVRQYIIVGLVMLCGQGCSKFLCSDEELGFARLENNAGALKINGYYYGDITGVNSGNPDVYLFNKNGVFINRRSFNLNDAIAGNVNLEINDLKKKYKGDYGVYRIEGNRLEIQYWTSQSNGCVSTLTEKGTITNDSTLKITSWSSSRDGKSKSVDAVFKFVHYSQKPDSVVSFIP
ncbi:hypothetical protein EJV47_21960 [Hymenobacter gummosus]|uniref:Lipocalin-like domain-containing protein n=1 Tax=Hymenobacter gummosus TaxID=1776032 RepID=A0A431TY21_9BACT|nr:hypothetical protein [Hymenobacter gummosus]RTQ46613.1 hypothetical protein EJV47_21960 [Hymenobacter gummosus]